MSGPIPAKSHFVGCHVGMTINFVKSCIFKEGKILSISLSSCFGQKCIEYSIPKRGRNVGDCIKQSLRVLLFPIAPLSSTREEYWNFIHKISCYTPIFCVICIHHSSVCCLNGSFILKRWCSHHWGGKLFEREGVFFKTESSFWITHRRVEKTNYWDYFNELNHKRQYFENIGVTQ